MIREYLSKFPKKTLSILPVRIHKLENLSKLLNSNIWCMRDDLTGFAFSGNKTRKLDFLIADAITKGADTIITTGANQSNFCRITAAYGKANGLEVHLMLRNEKPVKPTGNLILDQLFGARIYHVPTLLLEQEVDKLAAELKNEGKKVYIMPIGGSVPIGALGYVEAFAEITEFEEKNGIHFNHIIHSTGSGGTQAGLVAGQVISGWNGKITGICACDSAEFFNDIVFQLAAETLELIGTGVLDRKLVINDDHYIGGFYAARTPECDEAVELFAQQEGILLDYVYTGKAAAALIDYARKGKFGSEEKILFIHTGGNIQLFE